MTAELFVPILLALITALGGTGFWGYRQFRREAPVHKAEAEVAIAEKSQQMALAIAKRLDGDVETLKTDLATERAAREHLSGRVDEQGRMLREQERTISGLREVVRAFSAAWDDLTTNWEIVRQRPIPPAKPRTHNP